MTKTRNLVSGGSYAVGQKISDAVNGLDFWEYCVDSCGVLHSKE